jgi:outer membrane protein OmpA-like peptidoglycan-associated protein
VTRHQIDPSRIAVESRGSSEPVASNDSEAGREQNRRAVIVVTLP